MRRSLILLSLATIAAPQLARSQDAASILETLRQKQIERWEGVQTYMVDQTILGIRTQLYFDRIDVKDDAGDIHPAFVQIPQAEVDRRRAEAAGIQTLTPDQLEQMAQGYEMTGDALATGIEDGLEEAGLPRGLLGATGSKPWATLNPRVMLGGTATFLRAAAEGQRRGVAERAANAQQSVGDLEALADKAQLVGTEKVDGRTAFHLRAEGLDNTQEVDGQEFTLQSVSMWIDTEEYVPLSFETQGVATSDGESRPITIAKVDSDYRPVPDSRMYEPHRQTMRISGVMDEEQRAEMEEAQKKLAEFEKQMEQMPAAQREMIMSRMGSQMDAMKQMVSEGGFETVVEVHEVRVVRRIGE